MDSNKDEAERCIELAEKYILEGKRDKAERFLLKSEKLYSTKKAKDLLDNLKRFKTAANAPSNQEEVRNRSQPSQNSTKKERTSSENMDYTPEQFEAVKRVKKCKDYYEILGVTKEATDSDIKKAYKKLALHLHPDKNKAPGSAEAFKAIGNAVAILTDVEKRKQYDMFGSDGEKIRHHHTHSSEAYTRGFESDITADELFNMFFGGGFSGTTNTYVRRGNQWRRADQHNHSPNREPTNFSFLMQMLPVLMLIALTMMSSLLVSDPVYSLNQNSKYPVMKVTRVLKVTYYVKENFHKTYQGNIRRLEVAVEEEYISNLRNACYREKTYKDSLLWKASAYNDYVLQGKARAIKTPSCDILNDMNYK